MKIYTTITNVAYYSALQEDSRDGTTEWTINKHARAGDAVALYVCAPISAIVATAIISDEPYLDENVNSTGFGSYFARMEELRMLDVQITRHQLRASFPAWNYWKQPRNSVLVPAEFERALSELLGISMS